MAAARCAPIRLGNLRQMSKYARTVRRSYEESGGIAPGPEVPVPGLVDAKSRVAVPATALGQLVGVVVVESAEEVAFTDDDEALLTIVAALVGNAIEIERVRDAAADALPVHATSTIRVERSERSTRVRYFAADGSTFLDGDYLIKGVAGRLLWSLLRQYNEQGRVEFTNREVRLDPTLELPQFRDNFENRLVLLKRRLDERRAPIRIEKDGSRTVPSRRRRRSAPRVRRHRRLTGEAVRPSGCRSDDVLLVSQRCAYTSRTVTVRGVTPGIGASAYAAAPLACSSVSKMMTDIPTPSTGSNQYPHTTPGARRTTGNLMS
jgi:hypothetical protein